MVSRELQNPLDARYEFGGYYRSPRTELLPHVPSTVKRLLDVGCAAGEFGNALKQNRSIEVTGIELDPTAAAMAEKALDKVLIGDVEAMHLPFPEDYFDCICCADVLEHLKDPWKTLEKIKKHLVPEGMLIISLPNIAFYEIVFGMIQGYWTYTDHGILDQTHLRFFTPIEAQRMLEGCGFEIVTVEPLCCVNETILPRDDAGYVSVWGMRLGPLDDRQYLTLRTFQTLLIARRPPTNLLNAAKASLEAGDFMRAYRLTLLAKRDPIESRLSILRPASDRLGVVILPEEILRERAEKSPCDNRAQAEWAIALIQSNRVSEAKPIVQRARAADSSNTLAIAATGLAAVALGQDETGFKILAESIRLGETHPVVLHALLETGQKVNRCQELSALLGHVVEKSENVAVLCKFAVFLYNHDDRTGALRHLRRALDLAPTYETAARLLYEWESRKP